MRLFLIIFCANFFLSVSVFSQTNNEDDNRIDFGIPGDEKQSDEDDQKCFISKDADLLKLLNYKLKKFNPMAKENEGGPPLSAEEVEQKSIRFYTEQLKSVEPVNIEINTFTSLGGTTLKSLINRSSKVFLKHPEKCEFFSLYGDQIIGHFEISFDTILRLYASAVNKDNSIAQDFVRTQIVPSPMTLDTAIKSLYDDYGYQQNVIESLLPEDVRSLFFGENAVISIADVAESKLLAFSLLGGKIQDTYENEIFILAPDSKKGLLGSNETILLTSTGKIYEVPLLNIPLALNVMRSLGFNAKIIILKHIYIDENTFCLVGEGGLWYHHQGNNKNAGCDFLSNTIKSIESNTLTLGRDYPIFKESIDRVNSIFNKDM